MSDSDYVRNVCYVVSNELVKFSSLLPSNRNRSLLVHSLVKAFGLLDPSACNEKTCLHILRPTPAGHKDLLLYHTRDYLELVLKPNNEHFTHDSNRKAEFGLEEDCPPFAGLPEYVRLVAGATLAGLHHAQKSQASGFCYVADCILAILALKRVQLSSCQPPRKARIMYLDLDLHFSDAVSQAFSSSAHGSSAPQVLTLSIHYTAPGFFPPSKLAFLPNPEDALFDPFTLSLPLLRGASDATFARIWPCVERIKHAFQPDFLVIQCGVDGLAGDPNMIFNWSLNNSDGSLGWCIKRVCEEWRCPTLFLGGGGYNSANTSRAWTYLTSLALGRELSADAYIPEHPAFPTYAPSFTLDVPPGTMQDQNTDGYLAEVDTCFRRISDIIVERMSFTTE
ncbi:uncharacterized protein FIBRA_01416 [Fibroporia radiculosa]|uniref:histone deacetylase n=1 Tax=Fibroporia radiculosa TaxID=599839 RepID=J4G0Z2_9APHY|nr:uncharacterized protein FIBRA_01416 [Fibroporia radiculosa]CCL99398.1 predicted protein [Fibroporia radiculosa]